MFFSLLCLPLTFSKNHITKCKIHCRTLQDGIGINTFLFCFNFSVICLKIDIIRNYRARLFSGVDLLSSGLP